MKGIKIPTQRGGGRSVEGFKEGFHSPKAARF